MTVKICNPSTRDVEVLGSVEGQPGLHGEFQTSLNYAIRNGMWRVNYFIFFYGPLVIFVQRFQNYNNLFSAFNSQNFLSKSTSDPYQ